MFRLVGWLIDCMLKADCPLMRPEPIGERSAMENSERLGRQARSGFEPGIFRLPVLSVITPPLMGAKYFGKVTRKHTVN